MNELDHLRAKRQMARISGMALSKVSGVSRSRLSDLETGKTPPRGDELARLNQALEKLLAAREILIKKAIEVGYPVELIKC